ncbi:hypothetical protein GLYMA_02G158600v4 [Glycine max]|uniref:Uncharacterized protein n=1 Tax=Glycine max TaxID=3847 RepID=K7K8N2_SOYBN|nr:hypothetical protein GYH30_004166 [Glycine max]KRH71609.1 hypothetical protein GLYMA_02G158600v4 [Glycine max]
MSVSVDDIPIRYFFPICYTRSGDLVGKEANGGLVKFNDKGQLQKHQFYHKDRIGSSIAIYTESLLSLPCFSKQAEEVNQ